MRVHVRSTPTCRSRRTCSSSRERSSRARRGSARARASVPMRSCATRSWASVAASRTRRSKATLEDDVRIGPYSHLRPGAYLERGVEMGNFGEGKNARLRTGTKMHHFSYVGDADIEARVNIGAGAITLNYDGERKKRTTVGDDA